MAWCVKERLGALWRVVLSHGNHSRDRHGSIFDGAEWDELGSGKVRLADVRPVDVGRVASRLGDLWKPLSWSARLRLRGRGEGSCGTARSGAARRCVSSLGKSWKPPTRSAWSRLRCRKVGCVEVRLVVARRANVGPGLSCYGTTIVLARRPIDAAVVGSVRARRCPARYGKVGSGLETTPVQARFPIDAGGVGFVGASPVEASRCGLSQVWIWNQARAGTVPDQRRRLGMSC